MTSRSARRDRTPLVTVVIPARNEAADIERCLEAVAKQDYPADRLEVLVVDGASTDGTVAVAEAAFDRLGVPGRVIANAVGTTPSNLNTALAEASGDVLCRVDARSIVPPEYVSRVVDLLSEFPDIAVVGGAQVALARSEESMARGVARALNNHWGMGFSRYRRGAASGPSDTVYLGAFRTAQLRESGGWDERLRTNQDFDLNRRMSRMGTVWFDAELNVGYLPRPTVAELFNQYRRFGQWKVRYWRMTNDRPQCRQVVLVLGPPVIASATVLLGLKRTWRMRIVGGAAVVAGAVEVLGSDGPPTESPAVHFASLGVLATVSAGWLLGVWSELLRLPRQERHAAGRGRTAPVATERPREQEA